VLSKSGWRQEAACEEDIEEMQQERGEENRREAIVGQNALTDRNHGEFKVPQTWNARTSIYQNIVGNLEST